VYRKLRARLDIDYEIVGWVSLDEFVPESMNEELRHLGTLQHLEQIIRFYNVRQVIFSAHSVSYEQILKTMSDVHNPLVEFKMVPSNLEVIIGKSHIERLDDYPLLDIDYSIGKRFNRFTKRLMDVSVALFLLVLFLPYAGICELFCRKHRKKVEYHTSRGQTVSFPQFSNLSKNNPANLWYKLLAVLRGKLSLVGFPLDQHTPAPSREHYWYKPGLTGLVQINRDKIYQPDDAEKYHLFYMKNQSLLLDLEILFKTIFRPREKRI
jgi:lipopolysaccharide/colanic/teichoic acid biosynthesis glycosyltransferase